MENLKFLSLKEDPLLLESVIIEEQKKSKTDPHVKNLLESIYLESNRDSAFNRFYNSMEFNVIQKLMSFFGVTKNMRLCEIGGGSGFLTWALHIAGYNIELFEPNSHYHTGVGYLSTRPDTKKLKIYSDINQWHQESENYDIIITKNCIHHFQNISLSASIIRQKMKAGSKWFSFREWFADNTNDLYKAITEHPYCQKYNLYEWPYPASHYAEAIEIAGFNMECVVPFGYENNCLGMFSENQGSFYNRLLTSLIDFYLKNCPKKTVRSFWKEMQKNKFGKSNIKFYTRPQMMLFKKN